MAAANTDLLMEVGDPGTATTLSAPGYTAGGTSITVGSTSNWPTATGVVFAIDEAEIVDGEEVRVDGTYNEFVGTVATGTSITNVDWVRGVGDRDYAAGALTRVYIVVSAERENRIVEWGTAEHNQDGTHKLTDIITGQTTKATAVSADKLLILDSAASDAPKETTVAGLTPGLSGITNSQLSTTAGELGGAWTAYTPTCVGWSGTPTTTGSKYTRIGKTVIYNFKVSGTSNALTVTVGLPVAAATGTDAEVALGLARNNGNYSATPGRAIIDASSDANNVQCFSDMTSTGWVAAGDKEVRGVITYEAA